jgi:hypothetical protein
VSRWPNGRVVVTLVAALVLVVAPLFARADPADAGPGGRPATATAEPAKWRIFPLPVYATVPNEGSTYGLMGVFLRLAGAAGITSIFAPSVSWNSAVRWSGTLRYYSYPSPVTAWNAIASASTNVNRSLTFDWRSLPLVPGAWTTEFFAQARRSLFYRFFGLGPESRVEDESSYVRTTALGRGRVGANLARHLNLGLLGEVRGDWLARSMAFAHLPSLQDRFPDAPGIEGAGLVAVGLSVRYDTRPRLEYSEYGYGLEGIAAFVEGLRGADRFARLGFEARGLVPERSWLQGAARLLVTYVAGGDSADLPFYYQSTLGGELRLLGFTENRFIDRGAWEIDVEQRIRVLRTNWFGVTTDWRLDPFASAGQVFGDEHGPFHHVRWTVGFGMRVFVHPTLLARTDLAFGGEGIKAYVILGYPW